jgi:predicted HTH domain antitoxin
MQQTAISFSDDLLLSLNMSVGEIVSSMRKEYATKMYRDGKLTLGQGAEFCGMCLYDFTAVLAVQDLPVINYDPEDLDRELKSIGVL